MHWWGRALYVCVCVCVCVYMYMHIIHVCMCLYAYATTGKSTHTRWWFVPAKICLHSQKRCVNTNNSLEYMWRYTHTYTHTYIHTYIHTNMHIKHTGFAAVSVRRTSLFQRVYAMHYKPGSEMHVTHIHTHTNMQTYRIRCRFWRREFLSFQGYRRCTVSLARRCTIGPPSLPW